MQIMSTHPTKRNLEQAEFVKQVILDSRGLSGNAEIIFKYEKALCDYFGTKHAIATSSGTASIIAALVALNVQREEQIIVPVTGAVMTCLPILALNAIPLFVDSAKNGFGISIDDLLRLIGSNKRIRALISVPMWGYPGLSSEVLEICDKNNIPIIEDAAQAIGSSINGRFEGTNGLVGCFSTHEIKLLSTGEGGFVLTNSDEIAGRIRTFTRLGLNKQNNVASFGERFGLNFKLNAMSAALGIKELEILGGRLQERRDKIRKWELALSNNKYIGDIDFCKGGTLLNGYSLVKTFKQDLGRNVLAKVLYEKGFETDVIRYKYNLLPEYPVFNKYIEKEEKTNRFQNAKSLINRLLVLPTHSDILDQSIQHGARLINECISIIYREETCNVQS